MNFFFSFCSSRKRKAGGRVGGCRNSTNAITLLLTVKCVFVCVRREWRNGSCWSQRCYLQWHQIELSNAYSMSLWIYYPNARAWQQTLSQQRGPILKILNRN
jgi:hypothetical protein